MNDPINILIVDDQEGMRLSLKGILIKKGYKVDTAENGSQAIEEVKKKNYTAILMDIKMPGLSGVETYLKIKEIRPKAFVMMMTAYAAEDETQLAIREGAFTVLHKPLDIPNILQLLDERLQNKSLVLVVDDYLEDRRIFKSILKQKGFNVAEVDSGEDCIRCLPDKKYDAIILDLKLPGINGMETMEKIKKIRPDTVVIFVSGFADDHIIKQAEGMGSSAFLTKPLEIHKLLGELKKITK